MNLDSRNSSTPPTLMYRLEKMLFPRLPRWERHRRLKTIFIAALIAVFLAGIFAAVSVLKNTPGK